VLEFTGEGHRLVVFPDGQALVMGTTDAAETRSLVVEYIGSRRSMDARAHRVGTSRKSRGGVRRG